MSSVGIILGNGESRRSVEYTTFASLKGRLPVYGCNALYRDFQPTTLVAVDRQMIREIQIAKYTGKFVYRDKVDLVVTEGGKELTRLKSPGWAAGPTAALLLCLHERVDTCYMLGFDLYGKAGKVNNIYKGTENYVACDSPEIGYTNWVTQLNEVFKMFYTVRFLRVGDVKDEVPILWKNRVQFISIDQFRRNLA